MQTAATALAVIMVSGAAFAAVHTESIEYKHGDTVLEGFLAYDDNIEEPQPGVLLVHEWWGLNDHPKERAKRLAELGYVAFALDMYGKGKVTDDPRQAGQWAGEIRGDRAHLRERARLGLDVLRNHPKCDGSRIVSTGFCFGGTVSLELARDGAELVGATSFHGGLGTDMPAKEGAVKARILVLHGAADPAVPMDEVIAFADEMHAAKADWELDMYGGAKHSFTNPASAARESATVGYHPQADERSWRRFRVFLNDCFGEEQPLY